MRAQIYTNIGKSQIEDKGSHFKITGIPVTKNQSVMNRVAYTTEHNEKGIPTIEKQPITTGHPSVNGVNVSAKEGEGLNFYTGSLVGNAYLDSDDRWKVDTMINKKKLAAQDTGKRWMEILTNKEMFGVSTGLTFAKNDISGVLDGKEYDMVAMNQQYDHLAFLDPKVEKPAGGSDTMVSFNSEVEAGEVVICNIDDIEKPLVDKDEPSDAFIDRAVNKLKALFANDNQNSYNNTDLNTNNEECAMHDIIEAKLAAAKIEVNGLDDSAKLVKYNELILSEKEDSLKANSEDTPAWAKDLVAKVNTLESQLTANAEQELEALAGQVAGLNMKVNAEQAKTLGAAWCKEFLAANSAEYVASGYAAPQKRTAQANAKIDDGFDSVDLNAGLEGDK